MQKRFLILCTENSARSQMAEGLLRSFDPNLQVFSAGTNPSDKVNPFAVQVMKEIGIDILRQYPKSVKQFIEQPFDYVITVCDNAKETCPVFIGQVKHRFHLGFEDPAAVRGTDAEVSQVFRRIRDEIRRVFHNFYSQTLTHE
ncbi:MAG: arsenate reductase ArsC [Nitrospirae bacterium]|nr:arsenate reductase ArsC [Nitrospirota bacterium]